MTLLTAEDVDQILARYLEKGKTSIRIIKYNLSEKKDSGLGYLSSHLNLYVDYADDNSENHRHRFFIKTFEPNEKENYFLDESGIFKKEVDFYRVVIEDIRKYTGEVNWCPKYCFSKPRVLVLEDLSEKGFTMAKGDVTLDEPHVSLALKTLASMHASSMNLEKNVKSEPLPSKYYPVFEEILYVENTPERATSKWISWQIQDLLVGIDMLKNYTEDEKSIIKSKFSNQMMRVYPLSKQSNRFRNVLTHGDIWKNNLMFRYDDAEMPLECKLVDFQFFTYTPPANDVLSFLHLTTRKAVRDSNGDALLQYYHDCLRRELVARDMDVENELPWHEFKASCAVYKELALVKSLFSTHYILGPATLKTKNEDHEKYEEYLVNNRDSYMKDFFLRKPYAEKVTECMYELINNYIMKENNI